MEATFINTKNSKAKKSHKFVFNLSQRLYLRSAALQNLSIYYMWKNIRKQYKSNKIKVVAPT